MPRQVIVALLALVFLAPSGAALADLPSGVSSAATLPVPGPGLLSPLQVASAAFDDDLPPEEESQPGSDIGPSSVPVVRAAPILAAASEDTLPAVRSEPAPDMPAPAPIPTFPTELIPPGFYLACADLGGEPACAPAPVPWGVPVPMDVDGDPATGIAGLDGTVTFYPFDPREVRPGTTPEALLAATEALLSELESDLTAAFAPSFTYDSLLPDAAARPVRGSPFVVVSVPLPDPREGAVLAGELVDNHLVTFGADGRTGGLPQSVLAVLDIQLPALFESDQTDLHFRLRTTDPTDALIVFGALESRGPTAPRRTAVSLDMAPVADLDVDLLGIPWTSEADLRFRASTPTSIGFQWDATTKAGVASTVRAAVDRAPSDFQLKFAGDSRAGSFVYDATAPIDRVSGSYANSLGRAYAADVANVPARLATTWAFSESAKHLTYDADAPLGPATFDLSMGPGAPAAHLSMASLPPHITIRSAPNTIEVDPAGGVIRGLRARLASDGMFLAEVPAGPHVMAYRNGNVFRADLDYDGLAYARLDTANRELHLRLRNLAPMPLSADLFSDGSYLRTHGPILDLPTRMNLDVTKQALTLDSDAPFASLDFQASDGMRKTVVTARHVPPYLKLQESASKPGPADTYEFDVRTSATDPQGSATLGWAHVAIASNGVFLTDQPAEDHITLVQTPTSIHADILYTALSYAKAEFPAKEFHLDVRTMSPRIVSFDVQADKLKASGTVIEAPERLRIDATPALTKYQAFQADGSVADAITSLRLTYAEVKAPSEGPATSVDVTAKGVPASVRLDRVEVKKDGQLQSMRLTYAATTGVPELSLKATAEGFTIEGSLLLIPATWDLFFHTDGDFHFDAPDPLGLLSLKASNTTIQRLPATCRSAHDRVCAYANAATEAYQFDVAMRNLERVWVEQLPSEPDERRIEFVGGAGAQLEVYVNILPEEDLQVTLKGRIDPLPANLDVQAGKHIVFSSPSTFSVDVEGSFGSPKALGYTPAPPDISQGVSIRDGVSPKKDTPRPGIKYKLALDDVPLSVHIDLRDSVTQSFAVRDWHPPGAFVGDIEMTHPSVTESLAKVRTTVGDMIGATGAVWIGSAAYVMGGYKSGFTPVVMSDAILRYDPQAGTYDQMNARLPVAMSPYGAAATDGKVAYLFGGWTGCYTAPICWLDSILKYDPEADTVEPLAATLPSPRTSLSTVWDGQRYFYLIGGDSHAGALREIVRFDPVEEDAVVVATLPRTFTQGGAFWTGSTDDIIGGCIGFVCSTSFLRFDPATRAVTSHSLTSDLYDQFYAFTSVWTGSEAILFGPLTSEPGYRDGILRFEPKTATLKLSDLRFKEAKHYSQSVWTGKEAYVIAGPGSTSIFKYTIEMPGPDLDALFTLTGLAPDAATPQTISGTFTKTIGGTAAVVSLSAATNLHITYDAPDFSADLTAPGLKNVGLDVSEEGGLLKVDLRHDSSDLAGIIDLRDDDSNNGRVVFDAAPRTLGFDLRTKAVPQHCNGGKPREELAYLGVRAYDAPPEGSTLTYDARFGEFDVHVGATRLESVGFWMDMANHNAYGNMLFKDRAGTVDVRLSGTLFDLGDQYKPFLPDCTDFKLRKTTFEVDMDGDHLGQGALFIQDWELGGAAIDYVGVRADIASCGTLDCGKFEGKFTIYPLDLGIGPFVTFGVVRHVETYYARVPGPDFPFTGCVRQVALVPLILEEAEVCAGRTGGDPFG